MILIDVNYISFISSPAIIFQIALQEALPALEEARKALLNLSSAEITEIRSFAKPPTSVQRVCECVCILKNIKDLSWKSAKSMMSAGDFKVCAGGCSIEAWTTNTLICVHRTRS